MRRAVVTGGAGFVGAHLARALVERGVDVTCLDIVGPGPLLDGEIRLERCDVGAWPEVAGALSAAAPDVVFHSAGLLSATAEQRPQSAYRVNAVGTFNVLESARLLGIPRVVLTSTIATYGPGVAERVDERTQQRPTTIYGVSKVFSELLGEYYERRFGLEFRALRLPSVIGAGRGPGGASAYSSLLVSEPAVGRPYIAPVAPHTRMPIVYVKDAVGALIALADAPAGSLTQRTFGQAGLSPTAGEIAAAVRACVPDAVIEFAPDPAVMAIVDSWPREISGDAALAEWGWCDRFRLPRLVEDFVREERALLTRTAAQPA
jgi:threonine 3-dehydrogenase